MVNLFYKDTPGLISETANNNQNKWIVWHNNITTLTQTEYQREIAKEVAQKFQDLAANIKVMEM